MNDQMSEVRGLKAENVELREESERYRIAWERIVAEERAERERADKAEAELERLRSGIRSEVERLRRMAKAQGRSTNRGDQAAAIENKAAADRLEALLGAEK